MKSIKCFKYVNTNAFERFLSAYGYNLKDVESFSLAGRKQYRGNVLKIYHIDFKDGEYEYFKVVYFKNFNEYRQSYLSFNCIKLSGWYSSSNVIKYKTNYDGWYDITD